MTKITKHYHGFEVTIEPVDGHELTEKGLQQIEEYLSYAADIVATKLFFLKLNGAVISACEVAYNFELLLAKIEAKRMPKCREEHSNGIMDGKGNGYEVRECQDCHRVEWFKCHEEESITECDHAWIMARDKPISIDACVSHFFICIKCHKDIK